MAGWWDESFWKQRLKGQNMNDARTSPERIPEALHKCETWLTWAEFDGRKVPLTASGKATGYDDASAWVQLSDAIDVICKYQNRYLGVSLKKEGLVVDGGSLFCLDFDGFVCGNEVETGLTDLVYRIGSYAEISPSGTGIKVFLVTDQKPEKSWKISFAPSEFAQQNSDILKYGNRAVEVFSRGRFLAVTGEWYDPNNSLPLRHISSEELVAIFDEINQWARDGGGSGASKSAYDAQAKVPATTETSGEYAKPLLEDILEVLKYVDADDEVTWTDTANAMARTYGEQGRDAFLEYSRQSKKYDDNICNARYDRALQELTIHPTGYRAWHLIQVAKQHPSWPVSLDVRYEQPVATDDCGESVGDIKNGKLFAKMNRGRLLFVHESVDLLIFDPSVGWVHADPGEADRAAKNVVTVLREDAVRLSQGIKGEDDPKAELAKKLWSHVGRSSYKDKIRAMAEMAKSEKGMTVRLSELDADPWLLGVQNGVLDLRTGKLLAPSPIQMVTKRCNVAYDSNASTEIFQNFVERIQQQKPEMVKFMQRMAGYILTGEVSAHCFFFFFGNGRNGKTTLAELLYWMMGTYATVLPKETLMLAKRDPGAAAPDLMLLKGCRFALTAELEDGSRFDESRIKMLTGGDTMTARNPYGLFASWSPTAKLVIVGNHKPIISGNDRGIWSRVRLVPFDEKFVGDECDPDLPNKLKTFGSGLLNWALEGLAEYKAGGLRPPQEVLSAGADYQSDMDIIGQWMDEHVTEDANDSTRTQNLFNSYRTWARDSGWHRPMTRQGFGRRLSEKGVLLEKGTDGNKVARGIVLNTQGLLASARGAS